jgi:hypothetical protein
MLPIATEPLEAEKRKSVAAMVKRSFIVMVDIISCRENGLDQHGEFKSIDDHNNDIYVQNASHDKHTTRTLGGKGLLNC